MITLINYDALNYGNYHKLTRANLSALFLCCTLHNAYGEPAWHDYHNKHNANYLVLIQHISFVAKRQIVGKCFCNNLYV
jgi:hypothetical protein